LHLSNVIVVSTSSLPQIAHLAIHAPQDRIPLDENGYAALRFDLIETPLFDRSSYKVTGAALVA